MRFLFILSLLSIIINFPNAFAGDYCKPGAKVEAKWKDSWWKATVKNVKSNTCCVHYDGYAASMDECVTFNKIKVPGVSDKPVDPLAVKIGDKVEASGSHGWLEGTVIKIDASSGYPNFFLIHYDKVAGDIEDEWIVKDKIRPTGNI